MIAVTDWARTLELRRHELGMSKATLAKRAGVSLMTVNRILSGEDRGPRVTNLQAIAAALGVQIGIAEASSALEFRKAQAAAKAKRLVRMVQGTMALEAQAVDSHTIADMIEQTTCELLAGSDRKLWNE